MVEHIAIRREQFVAGGRSGAELGVFVQTHPRHRPTPAGRITRGEVVWMKWSSGPVVARARVRDFAEYSRVSPSEIREATRGYRLYHLDAYWNGRPDPAFGLVVYLQDGHWLEEPTYPPYRLSRGASWVIVPTGEVEGWLSA